MFKLLEYFACSAEFKTRPGMKDAALLYMQKNGVLFDNLHESSGDAYFTVYGKRINDKKLHIYADMIKKKGFIYDIKKSVKRPGLYIGAVIFIFALIISDAVIWEVKFVPNGNEDLARIERAARESGIVSGAFKSCVDRDGAENYIMLKCPDVSYVNVSVNGGVATVTTDERVLFEHGADDKKTDLFASDDGYILRYETYAGRTVCAKGQTVKQGDLLISGTYDTFHHGQVTVKARGKVYALVERDFLCEVNGKTYEKQYTGEEFTKTSVTVFSYGGDDKNSYDEKEYERYTEQDDVYIFGTIRLPLKIKRDTYRRYVMTEREVKEEEAAKKLDEMYEIQLKDVTGGGEIQSTDKKTYFEDGKYKLYCRVWLVCNIAK
ncbi:MAG: sporulation protein YqfD [Clostridia bacterium]|nr:sporulation protein YqfD [Clostridia bacterium]